MKRHVLNVLAAAAAVLWIAGCSSGPSTDGEAVVLRVRGEPVCSQNGVSNLLARGMRLHPGEKIATDANSRVWLHAKGIKSPLLIEPSSKVDYNELTNVYPSTPVKSDMRLDLKQGVVRANVSEADKIARFEIVTPLGVAAVMEPGNLELQVENLGKDGLRTTFGCGAGNAYIIGVAGYGPTSLTLHGGQQLVCCGISGTRNSVVVKSPPARQK